MKKIAYLISLYPAVSHTFIMREVECLRALGVDIGTFSVRKPPPEQVLGEQAIHEAQQTRWLLPANPVSYLRAHVWCFSTRPRRFLQTLFVAIGGGNDSVPQRTRWLFYFIEAVQLAHWLKQGGFQHLHVHFGNAGSNTAYLAARLLELPFSMTLHGIDLDEPKKFRLGAKLAFAEFAVCISEYGRSLLRAASSQEDWRKIHLVHCGFPVPPDDALQAPPGAGRLVCVARLSEEKGHLVLLDALSILRARGIPFTCVLVGEGPLRGSLEKRVKELSLETAVSFRGALPADSVQREFAGADIAVLSSFGEGIPMVLMEAFAQERPVVATRVGGIPELVLPGENGLLVEPGNGAELAAALAELLADPVRGTQYGKRGRETILQEFSPQVAAMRLAKFFDATPA